VTDYLGFSSVHHYILFLDHSPSVQGRYSFCCCNVLDVFHRDGELVLMDAGCEYHGYASDITRTWPVSGKFNDPQRELYELVLRVHKKCLKVRLITCLKHSLTYGQFKCEKLDERSLFDFLVPSFVKRMFHWTIYITPCCYFWERNLLVSGKKMF